MQDATLVAGGQGQCSSWWEVGAAGLMVPWPFHSGAVWWEKLLLILVFHCSQPLEPHLVRSYVWEHRTGLTLLWRAWS